MYFSVALLVLKNLWVSKPLITLIIKVKRKEGIRVKRIPSLIKPKTVNSIKTILPH